MTARMLARAGCWLARTSPVPVALLLVLGGCAPRSSADDHGLRVVASMSVIADFAREVAGEHAEVVSLVPIGGDPHVHEPTPADARAISDADLVLGNGIGLEPWFDTLVAGSGPEMLMLTEAVEHPVLEDDEGRPDPHLWMVPPLASGYVEAIATALAEVDPANADAYAANAAAYVERLGDLDDELAEALGSIPEGRRVLVTSHDAYSYFARHYDFDVDTIVGVTTEEEPSAAVIQGLIDRIEERGVPTVFVESTVNPAVVRRVARDAGVEVGRPLYGDSVGPPGSGADTYVGMMRANVDALVEGLAP
jgi:ABC-type Zn uptake system ZnuABC Zn-binding protein ZnuA